MSEEIQKAEQALEAAIKAEDEAVKNMDACIGVHKTAVDKGAAEQSVQGQLELVIAARKAREEAQEKLDSLIG